ncbi:carbon starvation protein A [Chromohalobacter sp. TMW 2.2308]|uniref:carbon starvation CstA family protein n=1 Tax=Chromohalobacter TaxID=42054 RepID=UPI001FFD0111|nr:MULTISPECIES: carbon starvation protein A [Chromohalobacter]MCK2043956.1 carbon starvation protein A [Chromohalobacter moromii]MCK2046359.1 carbon starvation protein A [Chromohalobacter moromii]MCT8515919.1 carbon starvation protein A [Chromohalobacter sp. TMW 2.2271]
MNAIWIAIFGAVCFVMGYRFYSKFIAERIYRLDPDFQTPAHAYQDGVDYVPTNKWILWGHHFTSVAGAAPIVGPAIAIYWGWLPAILWVVLGTVFAAGVHDFGAVVLSNRHKGHSIGTLANKLIGQRAKLLFLFIILILVLMINAVFAWVIAKLFITFPASVLSVFIQIPLAVWIGYRVYRHSGSMLLPSVIALAVMYGAALLASEVPFLQIDLVSWFGGGDTAVAGGFDATSMAFLVWIVVLMAYVYIASTLPVWKLLQPRDYINSHQLVVGLALLYLGLLVGAPEMTAPSVNGETDVSWYPLLFITIACGAISGFHGLVASGTTSKQLDKETDARFIGYGGALGEGMLAMIAIIAVGTLFASSADFTATYSSFSAAGSSGLGSFVKGAGQLAGNLGIPEHMGSTLVAVIVVSFAATTLDTAVRLMRYIIAELGNEYGMPVIARKHVATSIAVITSAALVILPEGPNGFGSGGYLLWPLFGTSNQLLAGITLMLVSVWLKRQGRPVVFTLVPMLFLLVMTLWAMAQQVIFTWSGFGDADRNLLLFTFGSLIMVFTLWILLEASRSFRQDPTAVQESLSSDDTR